MEDLESLDNKKMSLLLYLSDKVIFDKLSNEEAGMLIKAIFHYETTQEIPKLEPMLSILFETIKSKLDINRQKWDKKQKQCSEAAKERWKTYNEAMEYMRTHKDL